MSTDRSQILTEATKVRRSEVNWCFISDYWDGPISGLAYFRGGIYRCCCFPEDVPDQNVFVLQELTPAELAEELLRKEKFEEMVGTHWSYNPDGTPLPRILREERLSKQYYEEQKTERRIEPKPSDRPVVAWFDYTEEP